jgi:hypothetical protein
VVVSQWRNQRRPKCNGVAVVEISFPFAFLALCATILSPMLSKCMGPYTLCIEAGAHRPVRACIMVSTLAYNISRIQVLKRRVTI